MSETSDADRARRRAEPRRRAAAPTPAGCRAASFLKGAAAAGVLAGLASEALATRLRVRRGAVRRRRAGRPVAPRRVRRAERHRPGGRSRLRDVATERRHPAGRAAPAGRHVRDAPGDGAAEAALGRRARSASCTRWDRRSRTARTSRRWRRWSAPRPGRRCAPAGSTACSACATRARRSRGCSSAAAWPRPRSSARARSSRCGRWTRSAWTRRGTRSSAALWDTALRGLHDGRARALRSTGARSRSAR